MGNIIYVDVLWWHPRLSKLWIFIVNNLFLKILVLVIVMGTKIAKSGDLGTWASRKRIESNEFGEKLLQYA